MARYILLGDHLNWKEQWRSVFGTSGGWLQSLVGETMMLRWYADNWDTSLKVLHLNKLCHWCQYAPIGVVSYGDSHFGKPNKTIQASDVTCLGDEKALTECSLTTYELETGKQMLDNVEVVGVSCQVPKPCASGTASCTFSSSVGVPSQITITPTQTASVNCQKSHTQQSIPLYIVIGIMGVVIVAAIAVIALWVIAQNTCIPLLIILIFSSVLWLWSGLKRNFPKKWGITRL